MNDYCTTHVTPTPSLPVPDSTRSYEHATAHAQRGVTVGTCQGRVGFQVVLELPEAIGAGPDHHAVKRQTWRVT